MWPYEEKHQFSILLADLDSDRDLKRFDNLPRFEKTTKQQKKVPIQQEQMA